MRRVLYDKTGAPGHYPTGAGVLFDLANVPIGALQDAQLVKSKGRVVAWFREGFVWNGSGVLAFVKGSSPQGNLALPKTTLLRTKLSLTPAPFHPLLVRFEPPPLRWTWLERTLSDVLIAGHLV